MSTHTHLSSQAADTVFPVVRHVVAHLSAEGIPEAPEGELYADLGKPSCAAHGHDLPSDDDLLKRQRRRRALGTAVSTGDRWLDEWSDRFECWYLGLTIPSQTQLGSCMGALGLHIGSKLDAAWRASQLALGKPAAAIRAPAAGAAEAGCEWLEQAKYYDLPAFPDFPADELNFELPPLPRLLPSTHQLQSLLEQQQQAASSSPKFLYRASAQAAQVSSADGRAASLPWASAAAGGGIGFAASALVVFGLAHRGWLGRGRRGELQTGRAVIRRVS